MLIRIKLTRNNIKLIDIMDKYLFPERLSFKVSGGKGPGRGNNKE